jgi:hypothetical protein
MLDRHPNVGMVHCAVYVVTPERRRLRRHRLFRHTRVRPGLAEFTRYLGGHDVCCSTVMCRRELWKSAGPFEHRLMCADWLMWLRMALRTDIAYVASPLVDMRIHGSSMTSTMDPMRWFDEFVEVTDKAIDEMHERHAVPAQSVETLRRTSSERQGRRFLIATLAAAAAGDDRQVQGYLSVLERLKDRGASRVYWWAGRVLAVKGAKPIMRAIRTVRREVTRMRARCATV